MTADQENNADSPAPDLPSDADAVTETAATAQAAVDAKTASLGIADPAAPGAEGSVDAAGESPLEKADAALAEKKPVKRVAEDEAGNRSEATFIGDELNGESKMFNPEGGLIQKALFSKGVLNGPLVAYDGQGRMTQKAYYLNGQLSGKMTIFNQDLIRAQIYYKDDQMNGKARFYNDAGQLICVEIYKDGVRHGVCKWYDNHGNLLVKAPYMEGNQHGLRVEYYTTGDPRERATYKNNLLEGEVRRYYMDGTLMQKVLYHQGKQVGQLIEYDQYGHEKKDSWWVRFARWFQDKKKIDIDSAEGGGGVRG